MKIIKILCGLVIIGVIGTGFFQTNTTNYKKHLQIRDNYVQHPENLPTSTSAQLSSFGFQNLKADWYWLEAIQYVGGNAVGSEYKKYLYSMMNLITDLNPYFEHPYILGQLLLPSHNQRYEDLSQNQIDANIVQAETLGLKGIEKFCDAEKIQRIDAQDNLLEIWNNPIYQDPCKSYDVPYSLAFVYWHYLQDPLLASKYYKIASANTDSIEGAKTMAAIMQGKGGEREKSFFMFLNLAKYIAGDDQVCIGFANEFEQFGAAVFQNKHNLSGKNIEDISIAREKLFGVFQDEADDIQIDDTKCTSYINKSVREINLYYIELADAQYRLKNNGTPSLHAKQLLDDGYIDYLPRDFQRYEDYEIIYEYNPDTDSYDYGSGNYK